MEQNYVEYSKVLPGNVAGMIKNLITGEEGINTDYVIAKRVDCVSFQLSYLPNKIKLDVKFNPSEVVIGIDNLEDKVRRLISSSQSDCIIVNREDLGNFALLYKK